MNRILNTMAGSVAGIGLLALAGCASSVVPKDTRQTDSGISSVIEASLEANDLV
jgi:hypothetical protein